jgi:hypothetical protein
MQIPNIIKNPIFWVSIIIITGIIIYFSVSKPTPNIRSPCNSNQDLIDGKCLDKCSENKERVKEQCLDKCPSGKKRCGDTVNCYDVLTQYCDPATSTACDITNKDCKRCCPSGLSCKNGQCIETCKNICGNNCCNDPSKQYCCNQNYCCRSEKNCTKNQGCCEAPNTVCGDSCCNAEAGLICVKGECKIGCPAPDPKTNKLPDGFTGVPVECDPDDSVCFQDRTIPDINKQFKCIPKQCPWGDFSYEPNTPAYFDGNNKQYHVCKDVNTNNLWIAKNDSLPLSSKVNVSISDDILKKHSDIMSLNKCTNDACIQKIYQDGATEIQGLGLTKEELEKLINNKNTVISDDKKTCSSTLDCNDLLIDPTDITSLTSFCNSNSKNVDCCRDDKNTNYTGQICNNNSKCKQGTCYPIDDSKVSPYCNNNGKLSTNGCDCNIYYSGVYCQTPDKFINPVNNKIYDINTLLKYINIDYTLVKNQSVVPTSLNDNYLFLYIPTNLKISITNQYMVGPIEVDNNWTFFIFQYNDNNKYIYLTITGLNDINQDYIIHYNVGNVFGGSKSWYMDISADISEDKDYLTTVTVDGDNKESYNITNYINAKASLGDSNNSKPYEAWISLSSSDYSK